MDFGRAFSYVFEDSDWFKKIALAALVSLIPIVGQIFLIGWALEITSRVIKNHPTLLPDLDFGENLGKGFKAFVVGLVYAIPIFIFMIPNLLAPVMIKIIGEDAGSVVAILFSVCGGVLVFIYSILIAFLLPAAYGRVADTGNLADGLKVGEVFALVKKAPTAYLIVLVGSIVAGLVGQLGVIACVIGVLLTYTYSMAIMGHFWGQAYNEATGGHAVSPAASFEIPEP